MNRKKLSIAMIVRNEESNLKRCLDSFLPIIHERWCELLITDTGSTDRTLQVARQYTRKVFEEKFIPWDFSKARNHTIERAVGEKILIIDADEELVQSSLYLLEDTILNPKNTEPAVFVKVHNFYTQDKREYSEMLQPRISIRDGFHYQGSVHNKPIIKPPYLFAPYIVFNHYGYMFQGEKGGKLFEKKMERSLPMLIKEQEKHPENLHNLTHLVKTVYVTKDFVKTIKYGEIWISQMRLAQFNEGWTAFLEVFNNIIGAYLALDDIENAEKAEREACKYSNRIPGIYIMLGTYWSGKDTERAKEYFEIALNICKTKGSVYENLLVSNIKMVIPEILNWLSIHYFEKGDHEKAGEYMNEGIIMDKGRRPIRWDIWNASDKCKQAIGSNGGSTKIFNESDILSKVI